MVRLQEVNWKNKTKEVIKALELHSMENYSKIILTNYFLYNSFARADIAKILYEQLKNIQKNKSQSLSVQKNIILEIYSKYFQVTEDLALVGCMLLYSNKSNSPVHIYMESDNSDILNFYRCAYKGFTDGEISKIMGIDKLRHYIRSASHLGKKEVNIYNEIINKSIKIERNNFKMLAKLYIEETKDIKGQVHLNQAGPIDVYNNIKHGFKLVHSTRLSRSIWKNISENSINVMHRVVLDQSSGQKIIALGGFGSMNTKIIESIIYNIEHFANTLHSICEIRLWFEKDPMFVIKRFRLTKTEEILKTKKISVNDKCPCESEIKYKKCCRLFKFEFDHTDSYSLVDL